MERQLQAQLPTEKKKKKKSAELNYEILSLSEHPWQRLTLSQYDECRIVQEQMFLTLRLIRVKAERLG